MIYKTGGSKLEVLREVTEKKSRELYTKRKLRQRKKK